MRKGCKNARTFVFNSGVKIWVHTNPQGLWVAGYNNPNTDINIIFLNESRRRALGMIKESIVDRVKFSLAGGEITPTTSGGQIVKK